MGHDTHTNHDIALFRYALIREAADPTLSPRQRGELVRALAGTEHRGPAGRWVSVSRPTLDRWIRAWRAGGFEALAPRPRTGVAVVPKALLEQAVVQKKAAPGRSAAAIATQMRTANPTDRTPSERTLQRHFAVLGLNRSPDGSPPRSYGRFEAEAPNVRWVGDALHGLVVAGHKTYLFAFIDDHSRLLPGYRWGLAEDVIRLEAALHRGLASRGVPKGLYVDNGSPYASKWLLRACATLGIRLIHSRPGEPAGRGKIERLFGTVRREFLVEVEARGVADLAELNTLFAAWVETVYHRRVHSETGQAPIDRFAEAGFSAVLPTPDLLREAFLWSEWRSVTKVATVSLLSNSYEVDSALVGTRI
ncbi:MAG: DDE-type integrase/transposase/recombinase, partial [Actinomycetota bacterium]